MNCRDAAFQLHFVIFPFFFIAFEPLLGGIAIPIFLPLSIACMVFIYYNTKLRIWRCALQWTAGGNCHICGVNNQLKSETRYCCPNICASKIEYLNRKTMNSFHFLHCLWNVFFFHLFSSSKTALVGLLSYIERATR